jgi:hypothetical protein
MELPRLKIGTQDYIPVYVDGKHRYLSALLMGKSGGGKSSLISNWWEQDCYFKNSKILLEPAGFLSRECYSISKGKGDYCSLDEPISLNPMQAPYNPNQISDNIAEALNQVITVTTPNDKLTVKMRGILDSAVKWCLGNNRRSLLHVRDYIENLKGDKETRDGIISRLNFLITDERMQPILCGNNSIEWGQFIQEGKTLIFDAFGMSREKFIFAGNLISQGVKNYLRYERPKEYKPLSMFVDEAHLFVNFNFMDLLKEGRKYKLSAVLATQDFATIDDKLARVMCNVGTIVCFRVGAREAQIIGRELDMEPSTLQFLEKYHAAYLTPEDRGIVKAPRPPFFKKLEPKRVEPQRKSKGWFLLEPCRPA